MPAFMLTAFFLGSLVISNIAPGPESPEQKLKTAVEVTFSAGDFDYSKMND